MRARRWLSSEGVCARARKATVTAGQSDTVMYLDGVTECENLRNKHRRRRDTLERPNRAVWRSEHGTTGVHDDVALGAAAAAAAAATPRTARK